MQLKNEFVRETRLDVLYNSIHSVFTELLRSHLFILTGQDKPISHETMVKFVGGKSRNSGKVYKPVWPLIAHVAITNNLHPLDIVRGVFAYPPFPDFTPFPGHFTSERAVECGTRFKMENTAKLILSIKLAVQRLTMLTSAEVKNRLKLNLPSGLADVACSVMSRLNENPLACLIVATQIGSVKLIVQYLPEAAAAYVGYAEEIQMEFGKYLPDDLQDYARTIYCANVNNDVSIRYADECMRLRSAAGKQSNAGRR